MFIKIAQLFLSLTILVTLHEFGHFYFAKKFKCRVDKFYLFFDFLFPFANVMNFPLLSKKIGDTEYGIGWFPFGGYVQIAGMVDEQMDKTILTSEPKPWELRSKPAWQRLLVMMGGIIVNLILGVLIFWMIFFVWGKRSLPVTNLKYGLMVDSTAYDMGLRNGDYITALDGAPVKSVNRIPIEIIMNGIKNIEGVHADGQKFSIPVTDDNRALILKRLKRSFFVEERFILKLGQIDSTAYASNADMKKGDVFLAINDTKVKFYDEYKTQALLNRGKTVNLTLLRGRDTIHTSCKISSEGVMGFVPDELEETKYVDIEYGIFPAFIQGIKEGMEQIVMQAKQFVVIFTVKDAHKQVGGFYTMVQQMPSEWNWQRFWLFTGFLSLALAFMNFLPIPMLDGGYIMFILWEMITGKKVSDKVIYYANNVGLVIVMGLMIWANTDWLRN